MIFSSHDASLHGGGCKRLRHEGPGMAEANSLRELLRFTNYSDDGYCSGAVLSAERRRWGHRRYRKSLTNVFSALRERRTRTNSPGWH